MHQAKIMPELVRSECHSAWHLDPSLVIDWNCGAGHSIWGVRPDLAKPAPLAIIRRRLGDQVLNMAVIKVCIQKEDLCLGEREGWLSRLEIITANGVKAKGVNIVAGQIAVIGPGGIQLFHLHGEDSTVALVPRRVQSIV